MLKKTNRPAGRMRVARVRAHRYDAVALPDGLAFVGDSICSFNPIYGQVGIYRNMLFCLYVILFYDT